jgi:hypothetical protein
MPRRRLPITKHGHPWGGVDWSATMTGLDLPPPSRGQRVTSPRCGLGTGLLPAAPQGVRGGKLPTGAVVLAIGTLSCIAQAEPSGVCLRIDSIETSTDNLIYNRGHRDDQSDYRFGPVRCRPWLWRPWFFLHADGPVPEQGPSLCSGPVKVPPGPLEGLPPGVPPGAQQVPAGRPGSRQVRPDDLWCAPVAGQVRPSDVTIYSRGRGPLQDGPSRS